MRKDIQEQFLASYDQYADSIYRYCYLRLHSEAQARDVVQEAFARTWGYLLKDKTIDNMRAFLYQVSRNLIVDMRRKKALRISQEQSLEHLTETGLFQPSYEGDRDVERKVLFGEMEDAIRCLSPEYQDVLIMRYIEDLSLKEIAAILHTNPHNVSTKLYRAVKALQRVVHHESKLSLHHHN
jgi:RNA polymerase sigma-70 factor, ECF subfamily